MKTSPSGCIIWNETMKNMKGEFEAAPKTKSVTSLPCELSLAIPNSNLLSRYEYTGYFNIAPTLQKNIML